MTFDELHAILRKHNYISKNGGLLCPIVADMIEDTEGIIITNPIILEHLRECHRFLHVSSIYPSIRATIDPAHHWIEPSYEKESRIFVVIRCIKENPPGHYPSFSFTAYRRNQ